MATTPIQPGDDFQITYLPDGSLLVTQFEALAANDVIEWDDEFATGGGGTEYTVTLSGAFPAPSGVLARKLSLYRSVSGNMPSPSGVLARKLSLFRSVTGNMPSPSGEVSRGSASFSQAVYGAMPAPSGTLVKKIQKNPLCPFVFLVAEKKAPTCAPLALRTSKLRIFQVVRSR